MTTKRILPSGPGAIPSVRAGKARPSALTPVEFDEDAIEEKSDETSLEAIPATITVRAPRMRMSRVGGSRGRVPNSNKIETFLCHYLVGTISASGGGVIASSYPLSSLLTASADLGRVTALFDVTYLESLTIHVQRLNAQPSSGAVGSISYNAPVVFAVDWDANVTPGSLISVYEYDTSWIVSPNSSSGVILRKTWVQPKSRVQAPWNPAPSFQLGTLMAYGTGLVATASYFTVFAEFVIKARQRL